MPNMSNTAIDRKCHFSYMFIQFQNFYAKLLTNTSKVVKRERHYFLKMVSNLHILLYKTGILGPKDVSLSQFRSRPYWNTVTNFEGAGHKDYKNGSYVGPRVTPSDCRQFQNFTIATIFMSLKRWELKIKLMTINGCQNYS